MGPVWGTYLLIFLGVLGVLGLLAWILRAQIKRTIRYLIAWIERDKRAEEEARAQRQQRAQAEQEVQHLLHEDDEQEQQQPLQRQ